MTEAEFNQLLRTKQREQQRLRRADRAPAYDPPPASSSRVKTKPRTITAPRPSPPAPKHEEPLFETARGAACEQCGTACLPADLRAGKCPRCHEQTQLLQERWLRDSGIAPRHARLKTWGDLSGCAFPAYQRAVADLRDFLESKDAAILALVGGRGRGKTQMASVAVWENIVGGGTATIITAAELLMDLRAIGSEVGLRGEAQWLRRWRRPRLLAIDEFDERVERDPSRHLLPVLIDRRYRDCTKTILITAQSQDEFEALAGPCVVSRLLEGGRYTACDGWPPFRGGLPHC